MTSSVITLVGLACVFGAALLGVALRTVLPEQHLGPDSRDTIRIAIGMIATITALVLGLLIGSAKTSFDNKVSDLKEAGAKLILLDRTLREYGPDAKDIRDSLRQLITARLRQFGPEEGGEVVAVSAVGHGSGIEQLEPQLLALAPANDTQRWLKGKALDLNSAVEATRWQIFEQIGASVQWPLLVIMVSWLMAIFVSFGLFAPINASVVTALFISACSAAASIFLIRELDQPYSGVIKISSAPLRLALQAMGAP
jgi:hypothetical protein